MTKKEIYHIVIEKAVEELEILQRRLEDEIDEFEYEEDEEGDIITTDEQQEQIDELEKITELIDDINYQYYDYQLI